MNFEVLSVDHDRVKCSSHVPTDGAALPIVGGGDRPGQSAQIPGQRRPKNEGVEMARMIGEIDSLARLGLAINPAQGGAANQLGHDR